MGQKHGQKINAKNKNVLEFTILAWQFESRQGQQGLLRQNPTKSKKLCGVLVFVMCWAAWT